MLQDTEIAGSDQPDAQGPPGILPGEVHFRDNEDNKVGEETVEGTGKEDVLQEHGDHNYDMEPLGGGNGVESPLPPPPPMVPLNMHMMMQGSFPPHVPPPGPYMLPNNPFCYPMVFPPHHMPVPMPMNFFPFMLPHVTPPNIPSPISPGELPQQDFPTPLPPLQQAPPGTADSPLGGEDHMKQSEDANATSSFSNQQEKHSEMVGNDLPLPQPSFDQHFLINGAISAEPPPPPHSGCKEYDQKTAADAQSETPTQETVNSVSPAAAAAINDSTGATDAQVKTPILSVNPPRDALRPVQSVVPPVPAPVQTADSASSHQVTKSSRSPGHLKKSRHEKTVSPGLPCRPANNTSNTSSSPLPDREVQDEGGLKSKSISSSGSGIGGHHHGEAQSVRTNRHQNRFRHGGKRHHRSDGGSSVGGSGSSSNVGEAHACTNKPTQQQDPLRSTLDVDSPESELGAGDETMKFNVLQSPTGSCYEDSKEGGRAVECSPESGPDSGMSEWPDFDVISPAAFSKPVSATSTAMGMKGGDSRQGYKWTRSARERGNVSQL